MPEVSVIGLGTMGSTIARLLLRGGYRVTVWNRTASKADVLVKEGAALARTVADAISASPITVICVYDYKAAGSFLNGDEVSAAARGRTLVQLSTGSPEEARASELWARDRGAEYLDGAIQAAPSQMGRPDTPVLLSGSKAACQSAEPVLKVLAGSLSYLGENVSAASTMDLATLSYVYGAMLGFVHGARVCEVEGIPVDTYGAIVASISPTFGEFFKHEGAVIHSGNFAVSESPLRISVEATARLEQTARAAGINAEVVALAASVFQRAQAAGYADEEAAAIIKVLRANKL